MVGRLLLVHCFWSIVEFLMCCEELGCCHVISCCHLLLSSLFLRPSCEAISFSKICSVVLLKVLLILRSCQLSAATRPLSSPSLVCTIFGILRMSTRVAFICFSKGCELHF
jgi:hypothetical protein